MMKIFPFVAGIDIADNKDTSLSGIYVLDECTVKADVMIDFSIASDRYDAQLV